MNGTGAPTTTALTFKLQRLKLKLLPCFYQQNIDIDDFEKRRKFATTGQVIRAF